MFSYDCPGCGASLTFESSIAISAVCPYCRSLVIRRDLQVETLGRLAQLPPDLSPLQIGTTGTFLGTGFRLAGRLRWRWEGGSWTEWFAEMGNGSVGWLAEAQGFFTWSFEAGAENLPAVEEITPGSSLLIEGQGWRVIDWKEAVCLGGEGELPEPVASGAVRRSADLQGPGKQFATVESGTEGVAFYRGSFARFEEFQFAGLRPVPGWSAGADGSRVDGQTTRFSCPNCAAPVEIRAAGLTMSSVCGSCGTIIDTSDERHQVLEQAAEALRRFQPVIPVGRRGVFRGTEYEMIGYARRHDGYAGWDEYLLFNPWRGFDWLVSYQGHWTFVERLLDAPEPAGLTCQHSGTTYRLYADYTARVQGVLGEFYWQTATGEETRVRDYIDPPRVVSEETYPGLAEVTWSGGEYVPVREIATVFGLEKLPEPHGICLNQPNPHQEQWRGVRLLMVAALAMLMAVQIFHASTSPTRQVFAGTYLFKKVEATRVLTTDPFELTGPSGRVVIESRADVSNNWLGFDLTLVDETNGRRFEQDIGLEYYSGYDSDGAWSEGSKRKSASIGDVPAGKYRLVIETAADPNISEMPFHISIRRGGIFWSNFWLTLALIAVYPIWKLARAASFESARWSESDYGPSADSDDD